MALKQLDKIIIILMIMLLGVLVYFGTQFIPLWIRYNNAKTEFIKNCWNSIYVPE